jgi:hypothetical protein
VVILTVKGKQFKTKAFPLNFVLAITFPKNNPKINTHTPETDAISMDSLTGDQKSVAIVN